MVFVNGLDFWVYFSFFVEWEFLGLCFTNVIFKGKWMILLNNYENVYVISFLFCLFGIGGLMDERIGMLCVLWGILFFFDRFCRELN